MALYRQGSGSVIRASNNSGGGTLRHKRGRKFSRLQRISECSIGVFVIILFIILLLALLSSNYYPFSDGGDQHISENDEFYEQGHLSHFSFWNWRGQDRSLTESNGNKVDSGGNEIPEQEGTAEHKHNQDMVGNGMDQNPKVHFGQGYAGLGRDSRYWDRDDRRRYGLYDDEVSDFSKVDSKSSRDNKDKSNIGIVIGNHGQAGVRKAKVENENIEAKKFTDQDGHAKSSRNSDGHDSGNGLYNEKGRDELRLYEEQYEASLKRELGLEKTGKREDVDGFNKEHEIVGTVDGRNDENNLSESNKRSGNLHTNIVSNQEQVDLNDEYDDGIDDEDIHVEEIEVVNNRQDIQENNSENLSKNAVHHEQKDSLENGNSTYVVNIGLKDHRNGQNRVLGSHLDKESSLLLRGFHQDKVKGTLVSNPQLEDSSTDSNVNKRRTSLKKRMKRRKHAGVSCEPRFLDSTSHLAEREGNPKFTNFSLQYVESEEKPDGIDYWQPRFAGHQSLEERQVSFYADDQKIHCGFVKGPKGSPSTGFDLSEKDTEFLDTCHIAVSSCIFGNSDNLRTPPDKKVTQSSKKNVCFVMFVDEATLKTMAAEGRLPDDNGYIGLWKLVVVRNLPYTDMRRSGKVPKFLTHRLFPSARYSIWLDSKLRLQSDPLLILEYFLWRRGYEYAISNHYDRHCVWEEVIQNKKLNKFNHTIIDQQFDFYRSDGLTRFNASDPNKLLPSHVPEGSFIVRAHTPMSNLFSCLWFNEVNRFTPRDQLSFAYTYLKLWRVNPDKRFYLNMFKDCERRGIAKLFHHRTDEKPSIDKNTSL